MGKYEISDYQWEQMRGEMSNVWQTERIDKRNNMGSKNGSTVVRTAGEIRVMAYSV